MDRSGIRGTWGACKMLIFSNDLFCWENSSNAEQQHRLGQSWIELPCPRWLTQCSAAIALSCHCGQKGELILSRHIGVFNLAQLCRLVQAAPQAGGFSAGGRGLRLEPFVWQASRFQPAVRQRELADSDDLQSESACRGI